MENLEEVEPALAHKNLVLWNAIRKDHSSISDFARHARTAGFTITLAAIYGFIHCRVSPLSRCPPYDYLSLAWQLETMLGVSVDVLFPRRLYAHLMPGLELEVVAFSALPRKVSKSVRELTAPVTFQPEHGLTSTELRRKLRQAMSSLLDDEQEVLRLRFGLDDRLLHTMTQISEMFGVTPEAIRQTEQRAINQLRHPTRLRVVQSAL
jgi:RNA polymerase sigma factor (sigma-70 family)